MVRSKQTYTNDCKGGYICFAVVLILQANDVTPPLGVWDENVHRQRFREQNQNELKRKSFSHFYEDGDMCAAIDAPRSVEVKYICSTSIPQGQVTLTLEERDTCQVCSYFKPCFCFGLMSYVCSMC